MKTHLNISTFLIFFSVGFSWGQKPELKVETPALQAAIDRYLQCDVPTISVHQLLQLEDYILLDARELKEYEVSHLPGAIYIGYDDWDPEILASLPKTKQWIVYCTIGYRSEGIVRNLRNMGYDNVSNLYGSLYAWIEENGPLQDSQGLDTKQVHAYNKKWSQYMPDRGYEPVW